jgi:hypothetical protein
MLCVLCYHVRLVPKGPLGPYAVAFFEALSIVLFYLLSIRVGKVILGKLMIAFHTHMFI